MSGTSASLSDEFNTFTVVLIPKIGDLFSQEIYVGCVSESWISLTPDKTKNVNCVYLPPYHADAQEQATLIRDVVTNPYKYGIQNNKIDGMAISVLDDNITGMAIDYVRSKNVSVVTFDSNAPESNRVAYIGPNNTEFGVKLGVAMNKAQPEGGNYRILTGIGPNMEQRAMGVKSALANTKWVELSPPISCNESSTLATQHLHDLLDSDSNLQGIVSLGGWPMYEPEAFRLLSEKYKNQNRTLVVGEMTSAQQVLFFEKLC